MADAVAVYTTNTLIYTGQGILTGVTISTTNATGVVTTFYNNTAGSGTKILEVTCQASSPVVIFFPDALAIRFTTGLYVVVGTGVSVTVWSRQL